MKILKLKSKDSVMLFFAPGQNMLVHEQNPPTDLTVFVKRSKLQMIKN